MTYKGLNRERDLSKRGYMFRRGSRLMKMIKLIGILTIIYITAYTFAGPGAPL